MFYSCLVMYKLIVLSFCCVFFVDCDRPSCIKSPNSVVYVEQNNTQFNYVANPASVILPPADTAYSSVVLTQSLLSKHPDMLWTNYTVGSADRGVVVNTEILPIKEGILAHLEMFPNSSTGFCQQPFGVLLGDSFENDRVVIFTIAAGNNGSWYTNSRPQAVNFTILVCDNVTLCKQPAFLRHGPGGVSYWDTVLSKGVGNTCYYFEHFEVPITNGSTRRSFAFYFEEGNLYLYLTDFLPSYQLQAAPLQLFRRIVVGANLPNVQFFGGVNRANTADQCLFSQSLQYAYLTVNSVLVEYDQKGLIKNGAFCGADPSSELLCVAGTFQPPAGLYTLSQYRVQAEETVIRTVGGQACPIPYDAMMNPPQPIVWQRYSFSNCSYNYSAIVAALNNFDVYCQGISASKLTELCFGGVTLDVMRITLSYYTFFKSGVPTAFTNYNYKLSSSFTGCVHAYWLNGSSSEKLAYAARSPAKPIAAGGRQLDSDYINTVLNNPTLPWCSSGSCLALAVISVSTASAKDVVCPVTLNNTAIVTDKCVNFNVYGYSGKGVIKKMTNFTIPNDKLFLGSSSGGVAAFRGDNGNAYSVVPCATASVVAGYVPGYDRSLLLNGIACNLTDYAIVQPVSLAWRAVSNASVTTALDLSIGCLVGVQNNTAKSVSNCSMPLGDSYCLQVPTVQALSRTVDASSTLELVVYDPYVNTTVKTITPTYFIDVPSNFTIVASTEYIQTYTEKITIDCVRYLCGDSTLCQALLSQYGTFCVDINNALSNVHTLLDETVLSLVSSLTSGTQPISSTNFAEIGGEYNLTSLVGCLGTTCTANSYRSAISDLLFDKVTMADPGFMDAYQKCLEQAVGLFSNTDVRDLLCTQTFNGISVLPPIVSEAMQAVYTTALTGGIAASSWSFGIGSLAVIPFAQQLQYRLNGIGVTMDVLSQNQKLIANAFNNALSNIQAGFNATNQAIAKIQTAINNNAMQLNNLVAQLSNNFGAISSSVNEIYSRLDSLEANAQVDRLINGRFSVLNTYVTQLLIQASELKIAVNLASQKLSECVKSQSQRYDFCGEGRHVISFPQQAPNGVMFIHYSYKPTAYVHVCTTAGLCVNGTGYVPLEGIFVQKTNSCYGNWYISSRDFFSPMELQYSLMRKVDKCEANYSNVNTTAIEPITPTVPIIPDFKDVVDEIYNNISKRFNTTFNPSDYNFTGVDVTKELQQLNDVVRQLNESFIDLKELGTYTKVIRWPWYVWLGFIAGIVGLILAVVMILCMTNCCSCFKGACNCHVCHYDEDEDVYPAVRVNKRRA